MHTYTHKHTHIHIYTYIRRHEPKKKESYFELMVSVRRHVMLACLCFLFLQLFRNSLPKQHMMCVMLKDLSVSCSS